MSSYSDILENLHSIKPKEQYSGFNPLSAKKIKEHDPKIILWAMALIVLSCLVVLMFSFLSGKSEAEQSVESIEISGASVVQSGNVNYLEFEQQILDAQMEIDALIEEDQKLQLASLVSVKQVEPIIVKSAEIDAVSEKKVEIVVPITNEVESNKNIFSKSSVSNKVDSSQSQIIVSSVEPSFNVDQLLNMVKDNQIDEAIKYSQFLNETDKNIVLAKVYEKTDIKKSIEIYQKLILIENSPIEYVLKLAILNEKIGNANQSLYYYQLFNKHNTGYDQSVTVFVNKKIKQLKGAL